MENAGWNQHVVLRKVFKPLQPFISPACKTGISLPGPSHRVRLQRKCLCIGILTPNRKKHLEERINGKSTITRGGGLESPFPARHSDEWQECWPIALQEAVGAGLPLGPKRLCGKRSGRAPAVLDVSSVEGRGA